MRPRKNPQERNDAVEITALIQIGQDHVVRVKIKGAKYNNGQKSEANIT